MQQQSKARMTFRFDSPASKPVSAAAERTAKQPNEPNPLVGAPSLSTDIPAEQLSQGDRTDSIPKSPPALVPELVQDDIVALEELIRQSQPLLFERNVPPLNTIDVPHTSMLEWNPSRCGEQPSWWRVAVSVGGAVVTGALFGYLVLSLFTGESPFSSKVDPSGTASPVQATVGSTAAAGVTTSGKTENSGDQRSAAARATVPEKRYYGLQYGVFRTTDSMNAALSQLKSKGLPAAAMGKEGEYHVYASITASKEDADTTAGERPDVELYVKPIVLPAADVPESAASFFDESGKLIQSMTDLARVLLLDSSLRPLKKDEQNALHARQTAWKAAYAKAQTGSSRPSGAQQSDQREDAQKSNNAKTSDESGATGSVQLAPAAVDAAALLAKELESAQRSFAAYEAKPNRASLLAAQSALMHAVFADAKLRSLF